MTTLRFPKQLVREADPKELAQWLCRMIDRGVDRIEFHDAEITGPKSSLSNWVEQPD